MADEREQAINVIVDNAALIDKYTEDNSKLFGERLNDLYENINTRDEWIFELLDADITLTLSFCFAEEPMVRGPQWHVDTTKMMSACYYQAWVEVFGDEFISIVDKSGNKMNKAVSKVDTEELMQLAKEGIGKDKFDNARAANTTRQD